MLRELDNVNGDNTARKLRLAISETIIPPIKNDRGRAIKNDAHNTMNIDNNKKNKSIDSFNDFWINLQGRKLNKPEARRVYERIKCQLSGKELANRFNVLFKTREEKFIPYPAKWLRNEGWNDEGAIEKVNGDIVYRDKDGYIISEQEYNQG